MDTSSHWYEMLYDGTTLTTFFDGAQVSNIPAASISAVVMCPSICFRAGEGVAKTCTVEAFRVIQLA